MLQHFYLAHVDTEREREREREREIERLKGFVSPS